MFYRAAQGSSSFLFFFPLLVLLLYLFHCKLPNIIAVGPVLHRPVGTSFHDCSMPSEFACWRAGSSQQPITASGFLATYLPAPPILQSLADWWLAQPLAGCASLEVWLAHECCLQLPAGVLRRKPQPLQASWGTYVQLSGFTA